MNKFLTTIGLALVTLAAIWGGFWLTNRTGQENMSLPAVSETGNNRVEMRDGLKGETALKDSMDKNRVETHMTTQDMKQSMDEHGQVIQQKAGEMAENGRQMAEKAGQAAGQMGQAAKDMTHAANQAVKAQADLQKTMGAVKNGAANLAEDVKTSAGNVANNVKQMANTTTNNLAKEAEAMGVSHEQAMLLPNLGSGWHVVGKASNGIKIKDMKSGTEFVAQSERKGNTKHTILRHPQTGAQVREFTAQIQ
jgi:hypothetical protein